MPVADPVSLPASAGSVCWTGRVGPDDIDENGHMNVRAYDRVLEEADTVFFHGLGWTPDYPHQTRRGFFRVEKHVRYQAELLLGTAICATARIIETDLKRFHLFFGLWNTETGARSATMETLALHMDLDRRKAATMEPGPFAQVFLDLVQAQSGLPMPEGTGRNISTSRRS